MPRPSDELLTVIGKQYTNAALHSAFVISIIIMSTSKHHHLMLQWMQYDMVWRYMALAVTLLEACNQPVWQGTSVAAKTGRQNRWKAETVSLDSLELSSSAHLQPTNPCSWKGRTALVRSD